MEDALVPVQKLRKLATPTLYYNVIKFNFLNNFITRKKEVQISHKVYKFLARFEGEAVLSVFSAFYRNFFKQY